MPAYMCHAAGADMHIWVHVVCNRTCVPYSRTPVQSPLPKESAVCPCCTFLYRNMAYHRGWTVQVAGCLAHHALCADCRCCCLYWQSSNRHTSCIGHFCSCSAGTTQTGMSLHKTIFFNTPSLYLQDMTVLCCARCMFATRGYLS